MELTTAFSRETSEKVYVQHKLRAAGRELSEMLCAEDCLFYVCGDGARMAKDVRSAIVEMLQVRRNAPAFPASSSAGSRYHLKTAC